MVKIKRLAMPNVGKNMEQWTFSHTAGENYNVTMLKNYLAL